jgi:hypothetical protein
MKRRGRWRSSIRLVEHRDVELEVEADERPRADEAVHQFPLRTLPDLRSIAALRPALGAPPSPASRQSGDSG